MEKKLYQGRFNRNIMLLISAIGKRHNLQERKREVSVKTKKKKNLKKKTKRMKEKENKKKNEPTKIEVKKKYWEQILRKKERKKGRKSELNNR